LQKEPVKEKSKADAVLCWNNLLVSKVTRNHSHEFYSGLSVYIDKTRVAKKPEQNEGFWVCGGI